MFKSTIVTKSEKGINDSIDVYHEHARKNGHFGMKALLPKSVTNQPKSKIIASTGSTPSEKEKTVLETDKQVSLSTTAPESPNQNLISSNQSVQHEDLTTQLQGKQHMIEMLVVIIVILISFMIYNSYLTNSLTTQIMVMN